MLESIKLSEKQITIDLGELVLASLNGQIQVIIFNHDGKVTSSDEGLVSIMGKEKNIFSEPIFFGLNEVLEELDFEGEVSLHCVEADFFERLSVYDFRIKLIDNEGSDKLYTLIVHDLKDHYKIVEELRQERNNAEIQTQELIKAHMELNEVLQRELDGKKLLQNAQTQLVQNEKMVSLGQLTSGMAHEINNPLNFIHHGAQLLREKINVFFNTESKETSLKEALSFLDIIENGSNRIESVVKSLQLFNGKSNNEFILADLHSNLDATISLTSYDLMSDITIRKDYDVRISEVNCIPDKLNQVFINVLKNSIQSIPKGRRGEVVITTRLLSSMIEISIKDNGQGILLKNRRKIFDPFFTTRLIGEGKGLGLSISHSIIEKHNGSISFTSELETGTEFVIKLPLVKSN